MCLMNEGHSILCSCSKDVRRHHRNLLQLFYLLILYLEAWTPILKTSFLNQPQPVLCQQLQSRIFPRSGETEGSLQRSSMTLLRLTYSLSIRKHPTYWLKSSGLDSTGGVADFYRKQTVLFWYIWNIFGWFKRSVKLSFKLSSMSGKWKKRCITWKDKYKCHFYLTVQKLFFKLNSSWASEINKKAVYLYQAHLDSIHDLRIAFLAACGYLALLTMLT